MKILHTIEINAVSGGVPDGASDATLNNSTSKAFFFIGSMSLALTAPVLMTGQWVVGAAALAPAAFSYYMAYETFEPLHTQKA